MGLLRGYNRNIDIGVIPISGNKLQEDGIEFKLITETDIADINTINTLGIMQGDEIFILGFPMGISGNIKKHVIARGGIIARLDEEIIKEQHSFLVDSTIFPGNR